MNFNFKITKEFTSKKEMIKEAFKGVKMFKTLIPSLIISSIICALVQIPIWMGNDLLSRIFIFLSVIPFAIFFASFTFIVIASLETLEECHLGKIKGKGYYESDKMIVRSIEKVYSNTIQPYLKHVKISYSHLDNLDECDILFSNELNTDLQVNDIFTLKTHTIFYNNNLNKDLSYNAIKNKYKYKLVNNSKSLLTDN